MRRMGADRSILGRILWGAAALMLAAIFGAGTAGAVTPGQNGPIVLMEGSASSEPGNCCAAANTYVMGPGGENPQLLVPNSANPKVHPNGKEVYVWRDDGYGLWDLDGSHVRNLYPALQDISPDGR